LLKWFKSSSQAFNPKEFDSFAKFSFFFMDRWKRGCNPWATFSNKLPCEGGNLQIPWVEGGLIHLSQLSWGERDLTKFYLATFLTKLLGEEGGLAASSRKRMFLQVSSSNFLNQVA
jgi:hypothetical protein